MEKNLNQNKPARLMAVAAATVVLALTGCGGVSGGAGGGGADFPTREVMLTVPYPPGGSTDLTGRTLAKAMEGPLGQSVVVQNKAGANGAVGSAEILNSTADGYQTLLATQSLFSVTPLFVDNASTVTLDDMEIVAPVSEEGYVLVVNAESEYQDLGSLLEKEVVNFATAGVGSLGHFSSSALFGVAGTNSKDVPFDGGNEAMTAVMGNHADSVTIEVGPAMPRIEDGLLRPLVVFSEKRHESLPDVPTAKELGYDLDITVKRWIAVPKGTPENVLEVLARDIEEAKSTDEFRNFLKENFISNWSVEPGGIREIIDGDTAAYKELATKLNIGKAASE